MPQTKIGLDEYLSVYDVFDRYGKLTIPQLSVSVGLSTDISGIISCNLISAGILKRRGSEIFGTQYMFNDYENFAVFDLSSRFFSCAYTSPTQLVRKPVDFRYDDTFTYEDNLRMFLNRLLLHGFNAPGGIAVIIPPRICSDTDISDLIVPVPDSPDRISSVIFDVTGTAPSVMPDYREASAAGIYAIPGAAALSSVYLHLGYTLYSVYISNGSFNRGEHGRAGCAGIISMPDGSPIQFNGIGEDSAVIPASVIIRSLVADYDPEMIIIGSDMFRLRAGFPGKISAEAGNQFQKISPEIIVSRVSVPMSGASRILRRHHFMSYIKKQFAILR